MGRQRREVRELLHYMECMTLTMFLIRQLDPDEIAAAGLGTIEACETLATAPVASDEGWRWLARVVRHLGAVAEEQDDPRLVIIQALRAEVQARADQATAQKGS